MSESTLKTPPAGIPILQVPTLQRRPVAARIEPPPSPRFPRRGVLAAAGAVLLVIAAIGLYFIENPPGDPPEDITDAEIARIQAAVEKEQPIDERAVRDSQLRAAVVGEWDLPKQSKGDYRMVLREDKTGILTFTPNLKYRFPLQLWRGSLEFQIRWELRDGHVDMWSISGAPEHAFETAIKHEGRRKYFRLEKATAERLVLKNVKDGQVDDWRRIQ